VSANTSEREQDVKLCYKKHYKIIVFSLSIAWDICIRWFRWNIVSRCL